MNRQPATSCLNWKETGAESSGRSEVVGELNVFTALCHSNLDGQDDMVHRYNPGESTKPMPYAYAPTFSRVSVA